VILQGGSPLTQKAFPLLCLVKPEIDLGRKVLKLSFENFPKIEIPIRHDEENSDRINSFSVCIGKVCGDLVQGLDCGSDVSDW
jgi:molybdenum cofactor sulfurtransferase